MHERRTKVNDRLEIVERESDGTQEAIQATGRMMKEAGLVYDYHKARAIVEFATEVKEGWGTCIRDTVETVIDLWASVQEAMGTDGRVLDDLLREMRRQLKIKRYTVDGLIARGIDERGAHLMAADLIKAHEDTGADMEMLLDGYAKGQRLLTKDEILEAALQLDEDREA
jgi:DNA polymerase elongation subunit (family B)